MYYKTSFLVSILSILGSLDMIGNPHQFFKKISSGIVDLVE